MASYARESAAQTNAWPSFHPTGPLALPIDRDPRYIGPGSPESDNCFLSWVQKSERANVSESELEARRTFAADLLGRSAQQLDVALSGGGLAWTIKNYGLANSKAGRRRRIGHFSKKRSQ
jgi:hypothetical protein